MMKKYLSVLLSLLLLLSLAAGLSACKEEEVSPIPTLDLEAAAEKLSERGYTVDYVKYLNDEELLDIEGFLYAKKDDEQIWMYRCKSEKAAELRYELEALELEYRIDTVKQGLEYLEDILDELEDSLSSEEIADYENSIKRYKEALQKEENSFVGYDGCVVWRGTKTALEDTK
jgi:hypothetical protein